MTAKKKIVVALSCVLAVAAIVAASVMGTVAYLTSSAAVSNVFTIGKVGITMTETKVDADGKKLASGEQVDTNTYHLVPGKTYDKDPTIFVNAGSEDSYLFVLVRNDISAVAANTTENPSIATQLESNGWAKYTMASTGWVYVYCGVTDNGDGTFTSKVPSGDADKTVTGFTFNAVPETVKEGEYPLFSTFSIKSDAVLDTYGAAKITLTAVAIQDEGFNGNINNAWAAVKEAYPYIHTGEGSGS